MSCPNKSWGPCGAPLFRQPQDYQSPVWNPVQFIQSSEYAVSVRAPCLDRCQDQHCRVQCMYSNPREYRLH